MLEWLNDPLSGPRKKMIMMIAPGWSGGVHGVHDLALAQMALDVIPTLKRLSTTCVIEILTLSLSFDRIMCEFSSSA